MLGHFIRCTQFPVQPPASQGTHLGQPRDHFAKESPTTKSAKPNMSEPPNSIPAPRKRRRPALSCEQCRRRKIKCDRTYPCGQCLQSKTASCSYSPDTVRASRHVSDGASLPAQSSSVASQSPVAIPNRARGWLNGSTEHTSSVGVSPNGVSHSEATLPSSWTSPSTGHHDEEAPDPKALLDRIERVERELANSTTGSQAFFGCFEGYTAPSLSKGLRGTVSKTRFFGQSHWMYSHGAVRHSPP